MSYHNVILLSFEAIARLPLTIKSVFYNIMYNSNADSLGALRQFLKIKQSKALFQSVQLDFCLADDGSFGSDKFSGGWSVRGARAMLHLEHVSQRTQRNLYFR